MKILILLISVSLFMAIGFLLSFFWAVRSGQYDDSYTPSIRSIMDDNNSTKSK
ncbi:MAG: cbb3-type cytochrome oxidase assembly protein CcoS [Candidatus Marinimicrobia bacterium]|nr:cbb3-type cytochrome oxidase assembly protein CcoS [Candidatus Neomarinimicrobiota bacterium]